MAIRNQKRDSATITENKYFPGVLMKIRKLAHDNTESLTIYIFRVLKNHLKNLEDGK